MFGEFKNFKCITFFHLCFTASSNFTGEKPALERNVPAEGALPGRSPANAPTIMNGIVWRAGRINEKGILCTLKRRRYAGSERAQISRSTTKTWEIIPIERVWAVGRERATRGEISQYTISVTAVKRRGCDRAEDCRERGVQ